VSTSRPASPRSSCASCADASGRYAVTSACRGVNGISALWQLDELIRGGVAHADHTADRAKGWCRQVHAVAQFTGNSEVTRLGVTATRESLRKSRRPRVGPATLRLIRRATVRLPGLVSLALA
jgi:hypothetical protein